MGQLREGRGESRESFWRDSLNGRRGNTGLLGDKKEGRTQWDLGGTDPPLMQWPWARVMGVRGWCLGQGPNSIGTS